MRVKTCNTSKTRHYLAFEYVKVSYEALLFYIYYNNIFILELWRDTALTLNAVAGDLDFSVGNTAHAQLSA